MSSHKLKGEQRIHNKVTSICSALTTFKIYFVIAMQMEQVDNFSYPFQLNVLFTFHTIS